MDPQWLHLNANPDPAFCLSADPDPAAKPMRILILVRLKVEFLHTNYT
jgi:hypothetical protein